MYRRDNLLKWKEIQHAHHTKIEEAKWQAFAAASQSAQGTLNMAHLLQCQGKLHSLGVWGLWICRSFTDQTMCVAELCEPLQVVWMTTNKEDKSARILQGTRVTLVAPPFGWIVPHSPAEVKESSSDEREALGKMGLFSV